jgi:hypothetical protein
MGVFFFRVCWWLGIIWASRVLWGMRFEGRRDAAKDTFMLKKMKVLRSRQKLGMCGGWAHGPCSQKRTHPAQCLKLVAIDPCVRGHGGAFSIATHHKLWASYYFFFFVEMVGAWGALWASRGRGCLKRPHVHRNENSQIGTQIEWKLGLGQRVIHTKKNTFILCLNTGAAIESCLEGDKG